MTDHQFVSEAAAEPTRRERRKAETRQRLLDAARALFVTRGFEATRPQDIARLADVGSGTFYVHFADKRDVFSAFTEQAAAELTELMVERARGAPDIETRLRSSLDALLEYSDQHPGVVRACFADEDVISPAAAGEPQSVRGKSLRDLIARGLAQSLREGMLRGRVRRDYDPHVIAYGIVGFIQQSLLHGANTGVASAHLIENVTRFCGRALDIGSRSGTISGHTPAPDPVPEGDDSP